MPATKTAAKKAPAKKIATQKTTTRKYSPAAAKEVETELKAMKEGKLKSGKSGATVTNPKQAIGLSKARKEGKKVPAPPK